MTEWLSTSHPRIDALLDGGFPRGWITEIHGGGLTFLQGATLGVMSHGRSASMFAPAEWALREAFQRVRADIDHGCEIVVVSLAEVSDLQSIIPFMPATVSALNGTRTALVFLSGRGNEGVPKMLKFQAGLRLHVHEDPFKVEIVKTRFSAKQGLSVP